MSEIAIGLAVVTAATTGIIGAGVHYGTSYIESMFDKAKLANTDPLVLPPPPPSIQSAQPISE